MIKYIEKQDSRAQPVRSSIPVQAIARRTIKCVVSRERTTLGSGAYHVHGEPKPMGPLMPCPATWHHDKHLERHVRSNISLPASHRVLTHSGDGCL